jgi:hypothetical protein
MKNNNAGLDFDGRTADDSLTPSRDSLFVCSTVHKTRYKKFRQKSTKRNETKNNATHSVFDNKTTFESINRRDRFATQCAVYTCMHPPPPSPRSGTSFASAKSVVSMQRRRRKRKQEDSGNINININFNSHINTCREREEKFTSGAGDTKTNANANENANAIAGNCRRSALFSATSKRRWFRGDRKKVFVKSLIVFAALCFWTLLFRFEYNALQSTKYHNNTVYTKHAVENKNGYGGSDSDRDRNSDTDNGIVSSSSSSSSKSHAYDSIFCRASSFQMDKDSSSSSSGKNGPHKHQTTKPVFLWGIPSTTSEFETGRRTLLRKTYLDFYQKIHSDENYQKITAAANTSNATRFSDNHPSNTICSFHDWTCKAEVRTECQMIYVFFVGGHESFHNNETAAVERKTHHQHNNNNNNPKGGPPPPPFLLNESITDFREMLLPPDKYKDAKGGGFDFHEPGTVYLDIRENQFDGKMTTWFKFASLVATEYNTQTQTQAATTTTTTTTVHPKIEYVFKVDSDLILLTPHFFHWFEGVHGEQQKLQGIKLPQQQFETTKSSSNSLLPSPPDLVRRVYGGIEFPPTNCVENFTFDHPCPLPLSGPSYMSGELNFVSVELATYIASDDCPRDQWTIPHEDVSLSNYVYSYTNNTAYHKKCEEIQPVGNRKTRYNNNNHSIHIVGVNTSKVLLLPNMKANWETVSIRNNPDVLRSGELLWGHSIKRGNHTQYLYWKKDSKFRNFWLLFYKVYTTTGNVMRSSGRKKKTVPDSGNDSASISRSAFRQKVEQKRQQRQQRKGTNTTEKRVGKDVGRLLF